MLAPPEFRQLVAWGLGGGQRSGQLVRLRTRPLVGCGLDSRWIRTRQLVA